jgi:acyl carrier protein
MKDRIRTFLAENFPLGEDPSNLPADASLLEAGIIDSTGVLELVDFIEATYGVKVEDEDLLPENLDSVQNIVEFVERKRSAADSVQ